MATDGFTVAVTARDPATAADPVAAGGAAVALACDVRDEQSVAGMARAAAERGPVHTVVANAGVAGPTARCTRPRWQLAGLPGHRPGRGLCAVTGPRMDDVTGRRGTARGITEAEARTSVIAASPLARLVDATEVAAACAYLASDPAGSITGEDLNVNAGVVMNYVESGVVSRGASRSSSTRPRSRV